MGNEYVDFRKIIHKLDEDTVKSVLKWKAGKRLSSLFFKAKTLDDLTSETLKEHNSGYDSWMNILDRIQDEKHVSLEYTGYGRNALVYLEGAFKGVIKADGKPYFGTICNKKVDIFERGVTGYEKFPSSNVTSLHIKGDLFNFDLTLYDHVKKEIREDGDFLLDISFKTSFNVPFNGDSNILRTDYWDDLDHIYTSFRKDGKTYFRNGDKISNELHYGILGGPYRGNFRRNLEMQGGLRDAKGGELIYQGIMNANHLFPLVDHRMYVEGGTPDEEEEKVSLRLVGKSMKKKERILKVVNY